MVTGGAGSTWSTASQTEPASSSAKMSSARRWNAWAAEGSNHPAARRRTIACASSGPPVRWKISTWLASAITRAPTSISSPPSPAGHPLPSQRSWTCRTILATESPRPMRLVKRAPASQSARTA
jgi:hypothetical protein